MTPQTVDAGDGPDEIDPPRITRQRHELRRRTLSVARTERLTPHMIRLTVEGPELDGFISGAPDDHVKLFIPDDSAEGQARRDYTPRRYRDGQLLLDVVDHPGGPAADWAREVAVGDTVEIGGPRGSQVIEGGIAHWLLIGDETALPAIGRRIEETPADGAVTSLVAVPGAADEQQFDTKATLDARWLHRPLAEAADPAPYLKALEGITLPPRCFVWIAAEAGVTRAIREALLQRGHPKHWMKASGYWVRGEADASVKSMED
ncbi:MAG: siderophore-interacting protein [Marinobacter sp.]|jgi:NADPH-dependent ferric siderophore reductase